MTVIYAKKTKDGIWLGGDRKASDESGRGFIITQPKIFKNGKMLIGYTSDFRMGQVLQYTWNPPEHEDKEHISDMDYMVNDVIPDLKKLFDETEAEQGVFLIIYNNNIYMIEGCSSVFCLPEAAVGCGEDIAYGALGMLPTKFNQKHLAKVCAIVANHNMFVSSECDVMFLDKEGEFTHWHYDHKLHVVYSQTGDIK